MYQGETSPVNSRWRNRGFGREPRKPVALLVLTLLLAGLIAVSHFFRIPLSDSLLSFDFAVVYIVSGIAVLALGIAWLVWLWFQSGGSAWWSRGVPITVVLLVVAGLVLYRPVFQGALLPDRWEPRFWDSRNLETLDHNRTVVWAEGDSRAFPQFLGPQRDGVVQAFDGDLARIEDARRLWKKPIGEGWSGFVANGGLAWTLHQNGQYESVACIEIDTGNLQWEHRSPRRHEEALGGPGPRATPTLDQGRLFALGANGLLTCLEAGDGSVVWENDLSELLGIPVLTARNAAGQPTQLEDHDVAWGRSGSPLVYADLVIVPGGGPRDGDKVSLLAFDKTSGELRWRAGDQQIGYASPVLLSLDGVPQIVTVNESTITGHNPDTGVTLWSVPWPGDSGAASNTTQATAIGDNRILISKGYGVGGAVFEIERDDAGIWQPRPVWANPRVLKTKLTSAVVRDGYAWGLSDGILECVDLETGDRLWKNGRYGHGQVLLVGDWLLVHSEDGFIAVVAASPDDFQERGRLDTIGGVCWNTLCVYDDCILVRSDLEAACFRLPHRATVPEADGPGRPAVRDPAVLQETPESRADRSP